MKKPRQSVLSIHVSFVVIITVLITIFGISTLKMSYSSYQSALRAKMTGEVLSGLFQAVRHFGYERGRTNFMMNSGKPQSAHIQDYAIVDENREQGDFALRKALEALRTSDMHYDSRLVKKLWQMRVELNDMRREVDIAVRLSPERRDKELMYRFYGLVSSYIDVIVDLCGSLIQNADYVDDTGANLLDVEYRASQLRDNAGVVMAYTVTAAANPLKLSATQKEEIIYRKDRMEENMELLGRAVEYLADTELHTAFITMQTAVHGKGLEFYRRVFTEIAESGKASIDGRSATIFAVGTLESLNDFSVTAGKLAMEYFDEAARSAFLRLAISICVLVLIVLFLWYYISVVSRQIHQPLSDIIEKMQALSRGQREVITFETNRNDEIGDLAFVLKTFSEQHVRMMELTESLNDKVDAEVQKRDEGGNILIRQSRAASLSELVSLMVRQWEQPVSVIQSYAAKAKVMEKPDIPLEMIQLQAEYLQKSLLHFESFFRMDSAPVPFTICSVLSESVTLVQTLLEENGIQVQFLRCPYQAKVFGFESELKQALLSLLLNSRDALVRGGGYDKKIVLNCGCDERFVDLDIIDNGAGVPEDMKERLFQKNISQKPGAGAGLGLYTARLIVEERLNGSLEYVDDQTEGAHFRIRIPVYHGDW